MREGIGIRVQSAECRVQSAECRVQSAECRVQSAEGGAGSEKIRSHPICFFFLLLRI
jgi:hypothetical protein